MCLTYYNHDDHLRVEVRCLSRQVTIMGREVGVWCDISFFVVVVGVGGCWWLKHIFSCDIQTRRSELEKTSSYLFFLCHNRSYFLMYNVNIVTFLSCHFLCSIYFSSWHYIYICGFDKIHIYMKWVDLILLLYILACSGFDVICWHL